MVGPAAGAVIDAQNLNRLPLQPIRHDKRRPRDDQFARSRNAARTTHFRAFSQGLNEVDDPKDNSLRGRRILFGNKGSQRCEIVNGGWRPDGRHRLVGFGNSLPLSQESTHALT
ncbi:MAG: hypothetical protein QOF14_3172 [Hyphomicrobiales bacterium]|nr:hypothetical protein [Hyphomicrobiales bacterium]